MGRRYRPGGGHAAHCGDPGHLAWLRILYAPSRAHGRRSGRAGAERERARRGPRRTRPRHSRDRALGEVTRPRDRRTLNPQAIAGLASASSFALKAAPSAHGRSGGRTRSQPASPLWAARMAFNVAGNDGPLATTSMAACMRASEPEPLIMAWTRPGTTLAMPQMVPAPPAAMARVMSVSLPTVIARSGAAARNAWKFLKSPLESLRPATSAP